MEQTGGIWRRTNHHVNLRSDKAYLINIWRFGGQPAMEPAASEDHHHVRLLLRAVGRDETIRVPMQMSTTQMSDPQHRVDCITLTVEEGVVMEADLGRQLMQFYIRQPAGPVVGGSGVISFFEGEGESRGARNRLVPMTGDWRELASSTSTLSRQQVLVPSGHRGGRLWERYHMYVEIHELREGEDPERIRHLRGPFFREREQEEEGGSPGPSSAAIGPATEGKGKGRPELEWDEEEEPAAPEEATEVEGDRKGKGRVQGRVLAGREAAAAGFVAEKTTTKDRQGQQKGKLRTVTQRVSRYWLRGRMIPKEESPMSLDEPAGNGTENAAAAAERELSPMSLDVSVHSTEFEPPIFFRSHADCMGAQSAWLPLGYHPKLEVQRLKDMRAVFVRVRGQESADAELQLPSHRL
ncbi:hypothetical protein HDU89_001031 [Geranomyces variabilis]|nr:hypothetical protein HDU89_001031 [Geranomyces variabilis]